MRQKRQPIYNLDQVKQLVREGRYLTSKRVSGYLLNHGYLIDELVKDVIDSIDEENFEKSDELLYLPGVYADIYRHVECYDEKWYVKFFLDPSGEMQVRIWSLKEDGYQF